MTTQQRTTLVFDYDIKSYPGNPHFMQTPMGVPARIQDGDACAECDRLEALINTPRVDHFLESVRLEAAHQVERWGEAHDRAKQPGDWLWLLAHLATKAMIAAMAEQTDKALHHTISSAAVLYQWHKAITDGNADTPSDVEKMVAEVFGQAAVQEPGSSCEIVGCETGLPGTVPVNDAADYANFRVLICEKCANDLGVLPGDQLPSGREVFAIISNRKTAGRSDG